MRLLLALLLTAVAIASRDEWVEDTVLVDVSGCGERAPGKYLTNPKSTSCPVCDMDCDKEGQLAQGLIQESDVPPPLQ